MKLPFIDFEYFLNRYGSECNSYNLHQMTSVADLLETHKRKTIQVTEAIMEREKVLEEMTILLEEYHNYKYSTTNILLVVQKEVLILQKSLQKKGIQVVELIDKWRKDLSLDYPFRYMEYPNYLLKMRYDQEFVDYSEVSPYIFPYKNHPLLSNVPSLYYEKVDKLLETPDKKNPSVSSVTYPLTRNKMKMADLAVNAERVLSKYESIIMKEEENERTIKHFLFSLIKRGQFITILNVSEGEFLLTQEQQEKIKGIFSQNPEYVASYFCLSKARIMEQPLVPSRKEKFSITQAEAHAQDVADIEYEGLGKTVDSTFTEEKENLDQTIQEERAPSPIPEPISSLTNDTSKLQHNHVHHNGQHLQEQHYSNPYEEEAGMSVHISAGNSKEQQIYNFEDEDSVVLEQPHSENNASQLIEDVKLDLDYPRIHNQVSCEPVDSVLGDGTEQPNLVYPPASPKPQSDHFTPRSDFEEFDMSNPYDDDNELPRPTSQLNHLTPRSFQNTPSETIISPKRHSHSSSSSSFGEDFEDYS